MPDSKNYHKDSSRTTTLHKEYFYKDVCPITICSTMGLVPSLLLILVAKDYCFKTTHAILFILSSKVSFFPIPFDYTHSFHDICSTLQHLCSFPNRGSLQFIKVGTYILTLFITKKNTDIEGHKRVPSLPQNKQKTK
jgi:hypothetical protein